MRIIVICFANCVAFTSSLFLPQASAQDTEWDVSSGSVGVGTGSPQAKLHILGSGDSKLLVEDSDTGAPVQRELFEIKNKGNVSFNMTNTNANSTWKFVAGTEGNAVGGADSFRISKLGQGIKFQIFDSGNAILKGSLTQNSDVNAKQDIEPVDGEVLLEKLMNLPIAEWSYRHAPTSRHIGPMAQDFYRLFALGDTDRGITSIDTAGVALAAIQVLHTRFGLVQAENEDLKAQLRQQEKRIVQLEMALMEFLKAKSSEVQLSSVSN